MAQILETKLAFDKMPKKKIVLITSGQPSLNPRLVKEADSLAEAGYEVTVLYAYWNAWGTGHDAQLLSEKKWTAIRLGGDPLEKRTSWFISRGVHWLSRYLLQRTGNYPALSDLAVARSSYHLMRGAIKYKADLYIAHNLGALPAAAKTADYYKKPFGFDAEDFHRQEISDDVQSFDFKICKYLEDRYLSTARYITASSPLIAGFYAKLYNRAVTVILNVFPKINRKENAPVQNDRSLRLFWFSQTIGSHRGLEDVIEALYLQKHYGYELHLLGNLPEGVFKNDLLGKAVANGLPIFIHPPVPSSEIISFASQFDIGLAAETGDNLNRDSCLTNKIFTYLQAGLAVIASDTSAQRSLLHEYPSIGSCYQKKNAESLAAVLMDYDKKRGALQHAKNAALRLADTKLNWEIEQVKILAVIKHILIGDEQD